MGSGLEKTSRIKAVGRTWQRPEVVGSRDITAGLVMSARRNRRPGAD